MPLAGKYILKAIFHYTISRHSASSTLLLMNKGGRYKWATMLYIIWCWPFILVIIFLIRAAFVLPASRSKRKSKDYFIEKWNVKAAAAINLVFIGRNINTFNSRIDIIFMAISLSRSEPGLVKSLLLSEISAISYFWVDMKYQAAFIWHDPPFSTNHQISFV